MLDDVKTLIGLSAEDDSQDEKLKLVIELASARLAALLGTESVPAEMEYIAVEASVRRFNRIGSEGMQTHNVEGESIAYKDNSDFTDFMDDIEAYRSAHSNARRKIRFL